MIQTLIAALVATSLTASGTEPLRVVAKHNGEGIEIRWFPPAPEERAERWGYRVDRTDSSGDTLPITHTPHQVVLNVATLRDRLGSFAETYLGTVAKASAAKRINENAFNEALANSVARSFLVRSAVLYPEVADIMGWRQIDQDLQPGKTYTYRVVAMDRDNREAERVVGEARAVAARGGVSAPRSVSVSQPARDRLQVSWSRDRAREQSEAVLRYIVYRREGSGPWRSLGPGLTSPLQPSSGDSSAHVDRNVLAGRTYQYAVSAVDLTGRESSRSSSPSITVSDQQPPPPPLDVAIARSDAGLTLTWLTAGLPEDVTHIEVLKVRRPRAEGGPREVTKVLTKVGTKVGTHALRTPGLGRHEYAVRSVDAAGNRGPLSVTVAVTIDRAVRLKTPKGVRAKLTREGQVEVKWTAVRGTDAVTYVIERTVAGSSSPPTRISPATLGIRDKSFIDAAPPLDGAPLAYRVMAVDAASVHSAPSAWATLDDLRRAPAATLTATRASNEGVHLRWQAAESPVTKGFRVQVQVNEGRWANLPGKALEPGARAHTDTAGRTSESLVRYRVVSLGGASGPMIASNVVTLRRDTAALGVPGTPTVRCVAAGVEIRWSPAVGASSYEVQRALGSTQDFVSRADVSTTTWTDDQTVAGKRFEYRVVARHQLTASGASAPASIICSER